MIDYSILKIEIRIKRGRSIEFFDKYSGNFFDLISIDGKGNYQSDYLNVSLLPELCIQQLRLFLMRAIYTDDITRYRRSDLDVGNRFDYSFGGIECGGRHGVAKMVVSRTELDKHIYKIA